MGRRRSVSPALAGILFCMFLVGCDDEPVPSKEPVPSTASLERPIILKLIKENPNAGILATDNIPIAKEKVIKDLERQRDKIRSITRDPNLDRTKVADAIDKAQKDIKDGRY